MNRLFQRLCAFIYAQAKQLIHIGGPPGTATVTPRLRSVCWWIMNQARKWGQLPPEKKPAMSFITLSNGFTMVFSSRSFGRHHITVS